MEIGEKLKEQGYAVLPICNLTNSIWEASLLIPGCLTTPVY